MIDYLGPLLARQYGAALRMLADCIVACPADHWADMMAKHSFGSVAYHTLFFTELYLAPAGSPFEPRDVHVRVDGQRNGWGPRFSRAEAVDLVAHVRQRAAAAMAAETDESVRGPSGSKWHDHLTRGEMHVYNIRHVQHHAAQLAAHLRRVTPIGDDPTALDWIDRG